jgi:hypothetical protein
MLNVKNLIKEIQLLDKNEKQNILNLLLHNTTNEDYTKNLNGYFFNLLNVDLDTLENIDKTIKVIKESKLRLENTKKYEGEIETKELEKKQDNIFDEYDLEKYKIEDDDIIDILNENIIKEERNKIEIKIPDKRYKKSSNIYILKQLAKSRISKNIKYTNTRTCYDIDDNFIQDENITFDEEEIDNILNENDVNDVNDVDDVDIDIELVSENDLYDIDIDIDIENITIVENEILDDETIEDSELEKYKNVLNENGYKLKTGYKLIKEEYI